MKTITGTIIEAGYHLDAAGTIPGVSLEADSDDELRGWDGPLYGRRVVVVDEKDYDARETELQVLRAHRTSAKTALMCEVLEAELSSARAAALAAAARAAALSETAPAAWSAWLAAAKHLADVERVLRRVQDSATDDKEAGNAGKELK